MSSLIGFPDTKAQALRIKRKKSVLYKDIKIKPRFSFGDKKPVGYEVTGTIKPMFDETKKKGGRTVTTTYVRHKGRKVRVSSIIR